MSTTDVSLKKYLAQNERGQSIFEFLIMMPLVLGVVIVLVRVNTAIQVSIVNQKYARAQAIRLTYNSATYPEYRFRVPGAPAFRGGVSQMVVGVSDRVIPPSGIDNPRATEQLITRNHNNNLASRDEDRDARQRAEVRIRTTVALCTQINAPLIQNGDYEALCRRPKEE